MESSCSPSCGGIAYSPGCFQSVSVVWPVCMPSHWGQVINNGTRYELKAAGIRGIPKLDIRSRGMIQRMSLYAGPFCIFCVFEGRFFILYRATSEMRPTARYRVSKMGDACVGAALDAPCWSEDFFFTAMSMRWNTECELSLELGFTYGVCFARNCQKNKNSAISDRCIKSKVHMNRFWVNKILNNNVATY